MMKNILFLCLILGFSGGIGAMEPAMIVSFDAIKAAYHQKKNLCTYTQQDLDSFQQKLAPINKKFPFKKPQPLFELSREIEFSVRMLSLRAEFEQLNGALREYANLSLCVVPLQQRFRHDQALIKSEALLNDLFDRYIAHGRRLLQEKQRLQNSDSESCFIEWGLKAVQKRRKQFESTRVVKTRTIELLRDPKKNGLLFQQPYDIFQPFNGHTILSRLVLMGAAQEVETVLFGEKLHRGETLSDARKHVLEKKYKDLHPDGFSRREFVALHNTISLLSDSVCAVSSDFVNEYNEDGSTALHLACAQPDSAITRMLLDAGADVVAYDKEGYLPFHRAMVAGQVDNMMLFLYHDGFDCTQPTKGGMFPLELAVKKATMQVVQALLATSAADALLLQAAETPILFQAVERGDLAMVRALLVWKDALMIQDSQGRTVTNFALLRKQRNLPIVIELLKGDINLGAIGFPPAQIKLLKELLACKGIEESPRVREYILQLIMYSEEALRMEQLDREMRAKYEEENAKIEELKKRVSALKAQQKSQTQTVAQRIMKKIGKVVTEQAQRSVFEKVTSAQLPLFDELIKCIVKNNTKQLRRHLQNPKYKECLNKFHPINVNATLLGKAVAKDNFLAAEELIRQGAIARPPLDYYDQDNCFNLAIRNKSVRMLDLLLTASKLGAKELYQRYGLLFYAMRGESIDCLKLMIEKHGGAPYINLKSFDSCTIHDFTFDENLISYLDEYSLGEPEGRFVLLSMAEQNKMDSFFEAVYSGEVSRVAPYLVESPGWVHTRDRQGLTALHIAAREGDAELVSYLLSVGAKKTARMPRRAFMNYDTPLEAALAYYNEDVIMYAEEDSRRFVRYLKVFKELLDMDHQQNVIDLQHKIVFINYIYGGHVKEMQSMIDKGEVDWDWTNKTYFEVDESLLHIAARFGRHEVVRLLKRAGYDMDARDECGDNAFAVLFDDGCDVAMIDTLLEVGAPIDAIDEKGRTPLWSYNCAYEVKEQAVIEVMVKLIDAGLEVSHQDDSGDTILHYMCDRVNEGLYPETFSYLLSRLPELKDIRNQENKTIRDIINEKGLVSYGEILTRYEGLAI